MIDTKAPIIPGQQAAAIKLGSNIEDVLRQSEGIFASEPVTINGVGDRGTTRYISQSVDLWVNDGVIWQIMVHGQYSGKLLGKIGIGSTLTDVKNEIGFVVGDNLLVRGVPGISFDTELHEDTPTSPITEIYIFEPDWVDLRDVE